MKKPIILVALSMVMISACANEESKPARKNSKQEVALSYEKTADLFITQLAGTEKSKDGRALAIANNIDATTSSISITSSDNTVSSDGSVSCKVVGSDCIADPGHSSPGGAAAGHEEPGAPTGALPPGSEPAIDNCNSVGADGSSTLMYCEPTESKKWVDACKNISVDDDGNVMSPYIGCAMPPVGVTEDFCGVEAYADSFEPGVFYKEGDQVMVAASKDGGGASSPGVVSDKVVVGKCTESIKTKVDAGKSGEEILLDVLLGLIKDYDTNHDQLISTDERDLAFSGIVTQAFSESKSAK